MSVPPSTPSPQSPIAGWYSNPDGMGLRWWDGERWTEHVHPPVQVEKPEPNYTKMLVILLVAVGMIFGVVKLEEAGVQAHEEEQTRIEHPFVPRSARERTEQLECLKSGEC